MRGAWILLFAAAFVLHGCGLVGGSDGAKIGVVNVVKVVNESVHGKKANSELESLIKAKQAALSEKGAAVEQARKDLEKAADPAAKKTKEAELNRLSMEYQNTANASQAEIQKKANDLKNTVVGEIKQITDEVAASEKLTVVLTTDAAISFQKNLDITDKVLKKYDESK